MSDQHRKAFPRSDMGRNKFGSVEEGKDASHIVGFGFISGISEHTRGRPLSEANLEGATRAMNADSNVRIKTQHGNRSEDERHDAAIVHAYTEHIPLKGAANIDRAVHIQQHAQTITQYPSLSKNVGNIAVQRSDGSLTTVARVAKERQH